MKQELPALKTRLIDGYRQKKIEYLQKKQERQTTTVSEVKIRRLPKTPKVKTESSSKKKKSNKKIKSSREEKAAEQVYPKLKISEKSLNEKIVLQVQLPKQYKKQLKKFEAYLRGKLANRTEETVKHAETFKRDIVEILNLIGEMEKEYKEQGSPVLKKNGDEIKEDSVTTITKQVERSLVPHSSRTRRETSEERKDFESVYRKKLRAFFEGLRDENAKRSAAGEIDKRSRSEIKNAIGYDDMDTVMQLAWNKKKIKNRLYQVYKEKIEAIKCILSYEKEWKEQLNDATEDPELFEKAIALETIKLRSCFFKRLDASFDFSEFLPLLFVGSTISMDGPISNGNVVLNIELTKQHAYDMFFEMLKYHVKIVSG